MISVITGTVGLFVAALIILLIRKDRLHVQQGLGWIIVAIGFALLGFSPRVIDWLSSHLGIANPPILALMLGIVLLVVKTLLMDIERSRIEIRNQRLIQRVAMLEADMLKMQQPGTEDVDQD